MRKTALSIALAGALSFPLAAAAQGLHAEIDLQLPTVIPPMVVIQPGVQVIPEIDHEVFFVDGAYYARQGGGWYRAPSPHAGRWMAVPVRAVPVALVRLPPGHYKHWKPSKAEKEQAKAERKQAKGWEKASKKGSKHGKH
jgi:hypothetical protein